MSSKGAPTIDYKNVKLLKRYVSENGKILPSRITNISQRNKRAFAINKKSEKFSINLNMKVILLENIKKIGTIGEIINVKEVSQEII